MKQPVDQSRFLLTQAERALSGLDDDHRAIEPMPGAKTAGWLIGHLAVTGDFARRLLGRKPICPKEWRAAFNPGTTPSTDASQYPPMADLCSALRAVYTDLSEAALTADAQTLAAENPFEPTRATFPTAGVFVAYLLTGHLAYHVGQLVAWRAAAGLGRIEPDGVLARPSARE